MYDTILVPLDGSPAGESIFSHIEELAQKFGSRVVLTRVVEPIPVRADAIDRIDSEVASLKAREQEAWDYLRGKVGEFRERGIASDCYVMHGGIVDAIIKLAESEKADLIAMTTHGRSSLGQMLFGSVATGLIHRAEQPLLLVRSRQHS